jgi:hypothetical protein
MTLQRTLLLIPSIKMAESVINALFLNHCPWLSSLNNPEDKYIEMSRISIVTLTYTILLSLISIVSKGWQTVSFQLSRDQATSLTLMLASIYLSYSAYFLSQDFQNITMFMKIVMAILYIVLGYKNWKNTKRQIIGLDRITREALAANPNDVMAESIKVKISQMK